jgi:outer membrane autotransporter protein
MGNENYGVKFGAAGSTLTNNAGGGTFAGTINGVDARFGNIRAGFAAGYQRSDVRLNSRASSAGIDSVQFAAYAGGKFGAVNLRGGTSYSFDSIDANRTVVFPGFFDQTHARLDGNVAQVFGEIGYGINIDRIAVEPIAGLAYVRIHADRFAETGGVAALAGLGGNENIGYSTLGTRVASAMTLPNGTVLTPWGTVQWQYAFGEVSPSAALAFQGTGATFSIGGIPIARNVGVAGRWGRLAFIATNENQSRLSR